MGGALHVTPAPTIRFARSPTHRHRPASNGLRERRVPIEVEDEDGAHNSRADPASTAPAATPRRLEERNNNDRQHLETTTEDGAAEASHTPPACNGSFVHASVGGDAHAELEGNGMPAADGASPRSGAGQLAVGSTEAAKCEAGDAGDESLEASRIEASETSMLLSHTSLDSSGVLDESASMLDESLPLVAPVAIRVDVKHQ